MARTKRLKAADLVLDFELYPRGSVDSQNVAYIIEAIKAGRELPPVIIDADSHRVIDGFHRIKAYLKIDPDSEIDAIEKNYDTEADMLLDAMKYNSDHGYRLDSADRVRCIILAERHGITVDRLAVALGMTVEKVTGLRVDRVATNPSGLSIPLKRTFRHMAGERLTKKQIEVNEHSSGMAQLFYVNQVVDIIEGKLLEKDNADLVERLRHLHGLLGKLLNG